MMIATLLFALTLSGLDKSNGFVLPSSVSVEVAATTAVASTSTPPDGDDREYARVRRRRRGRKFREEDEGNEKESFDQDFETGDSAFGAERQRQKDAVYDDDEWIDYDRLDELLGDDDEDGSHIYDEQEYDLTSNVLIPNPLLDNIDPDGAAERFPELASDPRFWFDMILFVAFLNFLSFAGPQDPFPDIPWF